MVVENLLYILDTEVSSLAQFICLKYQCVFRPSNVGFLNVPTLWFSLVSGCPESLGPAFPCHGSLLAESFNS